MKALLRRLRKLREEQIIFGRDSADCLVLKVGFVYFTFYIDDSPIISYGGIEGGFHKFTNSRKMFFEIMRTVAENK